MRSVYEIKAQKELEAEGYVVDYKIRPMICPRGYSVDFFGLFDLIAIKYDPDIRLVTIRWIAIKGLSGNRHDLIRNIEAFQFPQQGNIKEIWWIVTKKGKKEWKKKILS